MKNKVAKLIEIEWENLQWLQGDLKEISKENIEKIKNSFRENGFVQPFFVWKESENNYWILDGHHRIKVLRELKAEGVEVPAQLPAIEIEAETREAAAKLVLIYSSTYAQITKDGLSEFLENFKLDLGEIKEEVEIGKLDLTGLQLNLESKKEEKKKELKLDLSEIEGIIKQYDLIIFNFSGGRDSTLAMEITLPIVRKLEKENAAFFVETGAEFPDVVDFVIEKTTKLKVPLEIKHPRKHIVQYYREKGKFPDSIYRDCNHKFINDVIDKEVIRLTEEGRKVLNIRGGREKQKTRISKSDFFQEIKKGKTIIKLLNPLFFLTEEDYNFLLGQKTIWGGYEKGMQRTACWFCPFVPENQWEAIRKQYPLIFARLVKLSKELEFPYHKNDGLRKRFYHYFKKY